MNYIEKVLEFATKAHAGQFRKFGQNVPYITHCIAVAGIARQWCKDRGFSQSQTDIVVSICYLHDVLEDTAVTRKDLSTFLINTGVPTDEMFEILDGVALVTKKKENFDLLEYLDNIKMDPCAVLCKLADNKHNSSDLPPGDMLDKYRLIKHYLEN